MRATFHPTIADWFAERFGVPTGVQEAAWPVIAAREHALITAPTGSGKTLAAFLVVLDRLLSGKLSPGATRVLYISPLKALNSDVRKNLLEPLSELQPLFPQAPEIRVQTRSGDTPQNARRRMLREPPEILITTPESLNLLLSTGSGRDILGSLDTVILDEIHAIAGNKRGTHLITAVERLTRFSGDFQRIAISATVSPLETIAAFVGGYTAAGPRPVRIVNAAVAKRCELRIQCPELDPEAKSRWPEIVCELRNTIEAHQSTLLFTNSRRMCERLTRMIHDEAEATIAFSHHGSLSRELRHAVEARLKAGELPAIVATSSLELGIDIGALDLVALIQSPPSVASAVQRLGRAGHNVHATTRGQLLPTHGRDFLDAAVLAQAIAEHDIEPLSPPKAPLDVLAQVIISMCLDAEWTLDALFCELRKSWTYHELPRRQFDLVIEMLAGKYDRIRLRELRPRLSIDREAGTVRARKGASQALYSSGGTIPDRGYFQLRDHATGAQLGELDEEFVWEQKPGVTFVLGTRA